MNIEKVFQDKKAIIWMFGKPYASVTYYCLRENLEMVVSTLKETAYQYLKDDENIVVMNVSTFKKLIEKLAESEG